MKSILVSNETTTEQVQPTLSLVVASHYPVSLTKQCIDAIFQNAGRVTEIIVVRDQSKGGHEALKSAYPKVIWVDAPSRCTIPQLRLIGWQRSRGEYIAFIEDDCIVAESWLEAILGRHRNGVAVVGGPLIADDYHSPVDWAMFLCEYGRFAGATAKKVKSLPGNNTSYKRTLLDEHLARFTRDSGIYDVFLNGSLMQSGTDLHFDAGMAIKNINRWSFRDLTIGALHHGRCFAAMRLHNAGILTRLMYAGLTLLLPPLLMFKLFIAVCKTRYLLQFILCIPQACLFYLYWASGECLGSLVGAGDSAGYWL